MSAFKLPLARAVENPKNFSLPNSSHTNRFKWKEICVWTSLVVPSFNSWARELPKYWRTAVESDQCVDYLHGRWVWAKPTHVSLEPTGGPAKMLAVELHQSGGGMTLKHWEIVQTHITHKVCVRPVYKVSTPLGLAQLRRCSLKLIRPAHLEFPFQDRPTLARASNNFTQENSSTASRLASSHTHTRHRRIKSFKERPSTPISGEPHHPEMFEIEGSIFHHTV
jgi:hypothetical protein